VASRPTCPNLATSTRGQKSTHATASHTDGPDFSHCHRLCEFSSAVLRLAPAVSVTQHLMQPHHLASAHNPEASVPASTVQCRWREASRCWQQACMVPKHGRQSVRYAACPNLLHLCAGLCWSALLEQPWAVVKLGSSHKQVSTSLQQHLL
jgi:hypothetical protein